MVHAKNYENMSTFVKVTQKKIWPLFSGHGVESLSYIFTADSMGLSSFKFFRCAP